MTQDRQTLESAGVREDSGRPSTAETVTPGSPAGQPSALPQVGSTAQRSRFRRTVRVAYFVSHPIQYQTPLLRRLSQEPDIELMVFFGSDFSLHGYKDPGFGLTVKWDVPLLDGYKYEFLPKLRDANNEGTFSPISRGVFSRLKDQHGEPRFDVVWVHGYATVNQMQAILAAKRLGIPVMIRADSWLGDRERSAVKKAAKTLFFQALGRLVDAVLVTGEPNRVYWEHYFGGEVPLFLVPYAVDNQYFQQKSALAQATRGEMRQTLNLEPGRPVILFASKLERRKHCDDLIAAYAMLSEGPGQDPLPYLLIVGDGEARQELEAQAAATGFSSIRFCGFANQSELPRYFDLASVFVLGSRIEPWGLIVNEVMNASRAVVVSDKVGCRFDLITDGVEGYVYPVRDVPALADSLRRVLASPGYGEQMGRNALERINHWSYEEDVQGIRQALLHLVHGPA